VGCCCCLWRRSVLQVSSTVEFTRIWWDKHSKHPSMTQVSLWHPVPPPGYVILGDCMITGMYCPPSNALVLRDTDPSELVDGRPPLLARPLSCVSVRALSCCWGLCF
jgi:vacuolar protein sorting-associated protein 13A/C